MPVKSMRNFILVNFPFKIKLNNLVKMIYFRWVSLLHDNLNDVLPFELFILNYWYIDDLNLSEMLNTYSLVKKSTPGMIRSDIAFMNSRNSSFSFLLSY